MAKHRSTEERQREVAGWRASGRSAAEYAARRGYSAESLFRWARPPSCAPLALSSGAPHFVRLEVTASAPRPAEVVVELGRARIRVPAGFDPEHLRAIVDALTSRTPE